MDSLLQVFIYLLAAVISVVVGKRFGLSSVFGYIFAGVLIGPYILNFMSDAQRFQHFAEFGIVIMLFLVGLEMRPLMLWEMRTRIFGLGALQVTVTATLISGSAFLLGCSREASIAIGLTLSLSSSTIVLQTLSEKGLSKTEGGLLSVHVLLFQVVAVILILVLIPISNTFSSNEVDSSFNSLPGSASPFISLGIILAVLFFGHFLLRRLFRFIVKYRLREISLASALLIVVGVSLIMTSVGLSPALGALIAGIMLSNSEFRHTIASDLEPFKVLLIGLLFIAIGAGIDFSIVINYPLIVIGLTIGLLLLKIFVLLVIAQLIKLNRNDQWLFALGLSPAGEFGFILLSLSQENYVIPSELVGILLIVVTMSMLLSMLFMRFSNKIIDIAGVAKSDSRSLDVFISYSRENLIQANRLYASLESEAFNVFFDLRDLPYGEEWRKELDRSIRESDIIIWLVSKNSIKSRWCNWELSRASVYAKRIIPVLIDEVEIRLLPNELKKIQFFPRSGIFDLNDREQFRNLIKALRRDFAWLKEYTYLAERAVLWNNDERRPYWLLRKGELDKAKLWLLKISDSSQEIDANVLDLINTSDFTESSR